ncbi:MAG: DUF5723 family protein [Aureispira sp.]
MKHILLTILAILLVGQLMAQTYSGVSESQYAGYLGTTINPANIVNPNYKADIHLLSFNTALVNDYLKINIDSAVNGTGNFLDRFEDQNPNSTSANLGFDFEMNWLGGMFAINKKIGVGFGIKSRALVSAKGFNKDLIRMSASGLEDSTYYGQSFTDEYTSLTAASWNEYSLYFGAEIMNTGAHKVTVGGGFNLLQSNGSFHLYMEDLAYEFQDEDTIARVQGTVTYGGNFSDIPASLGTTFVPFAPGNTANSNFGFSMDVGATYEFTPGGSGKYKLKAGVAFHDIGFLAATPDDRVSNRITFDLQDIAVNNFDGIQDFDGINNLIVQDTVAYNYDQYNRELMMQAPTRMNIFVDYNVVKGFYVSFLSDVALYRQNNGHRLVGINSFELTPRYDFKWFGVAFPINYVQYSGFGIGVGLRVGPFYAGTSNLITAFGAGKEWSSLNAYMGFRIPLFKKKAK